jgi:biotin carboxylase
MTEREARQATIDRAAFAVRSCESAKAAYEQAQRAMTLAVRAVWGDNCRDVTRDIMMRDGITYHVYFDGDGYVTTSYDNTIAVLSRHQSHIAQEDS